MNAPVQAAWRKVAVGLGSSLGDRVGTLEFAVRALGRQPDTVLLRSSSWYRTPPMRGGSANGWFLNAVAVYASCAPASAWLARCRDLEARAGRRRARRWGDRPLDLDILIIEGEAYQTADLQVPHPAWRTRTFVVAPLREVWPAGLDPETGETLEQTPDPPGPRAVRVGVVARAAGPVTTTDLAAPTRRTR